MEVRARLGDHVEAGATLLVIDSSDITAAYSEFVKEASELEYSTRAQELAKDLHATKALALKDLKQAENDLIKARANSGVRKNDCYPCGFRARNWRNRSTQQRITSRFEMKSPLTGTVVERNRDARPVDRKRCRSGRVHGGRSGSTAGGGGCL